jgi:flagellar protein FlaJ
MLSARPEFGPLEKQIREVAKIAMSGVGLDEALLTISRNIRSDMLRRTINLIIEGMKSGGEFATLLENIALDIKDLSILQREVRASVTMYAIFILIAAVVAAPLLFGISTFLISQITSITSSIDVPQEAIASLPLSINLGAPSISSDFVFYFALVIVCMTSGFAALIMSLIMTGEEKDGVKYIPVFVTVSVIIFLIVKTVMSSMISSGSMF